MKTLKTIIVLALSTAFLSACHHDQKWDSKSSADTLNNMKDSIYDSTKSNTKALIMKVNKSDARFAVNAASGGNAEVALGHLAQQRAATQQLKDFGTMMVADHSKADRQLKTIASDKGIALPQTLDKNAREEQNDLSSKSGTDFDKAYVKLMIKDHKMDIDSFRYAIRHLRDTDLKAFAEKTLPVLQKHLDAIEKIDQSMEK